MHSKIDLSTILNDVPGVTERDCDKYNVGLSSVDFEKAIFLTGFGKFQYLILIVSGLIFASAGFQNGLNAYVLPAAESDLSMSSSDKGLLNAVFLIGGLASAFFWGILADHVGRKKVLVVSLLLDGILTLISSLSQTFAVFAAFRFLSGFIIGAPGSIVVPYLGEFFSNSHRAPVLCAVGFFWTVSWIVLPAAALGIIPITWSYQVQGFTFNSWRIYVALFAVPTLVCGTLLALYLPESPKYLFSQGKESEALSVLKYMHGITYGKSRGEYPVKTILSDGKEGPTTSSIILNTITSHPPSMSSKPSLYMICKKIWSQAISLFSYPIIRSTILASALTFTNMFGYYGLGLWLPDLFNRFEEHYKISNESVTVCQITSGSKNYSYRLTASEEENLTDFLSDDIGIGSGMNPSVFINTFIIGTACLVANIVSAALAKKVGLKLLTVVTMLVAGLSAMGIYFLKTPQQNLLVSCIFLAFVGTGNTVINSAVVDLFPTKIRALAVCTATFAGRLGAVASNLTLGYVLDISCEVPIFLMGFILLSGSLLGFFLPSSSDQKSCDKSRSVSTA